MHIMEKTIQVKDYLTKSNLPASDYVINPYIGCPHGCVYCYACFMKRFTGHKEKWGSFVDIKLCDKPINLNKIKGKSVFLSSVTDCYNPLEERYGVTRRILEQLTEADCEIGISTKSGLILRDLDLLKKCKNLKVSMSLNTLDEGFRKDMDHADAIMNRLETLKKLHDNGIYTVLFLSPMFPMLTDYKAILEQTRGFIDEYWFENLNLRGSYKETILSYIDEKFPQFSEIYNRIYVQGKMDYWQNLAIEIEEYCKERNIKHINYFYHEELVKNKKTKEENNLLSEK